jgi:hypothetical protein
MFSFVKNKEFDFEEYIKELGYVKQAESENHVEYQNHRYSIFLRIDDMGYNNLSIKYDGVNFVSMKFIPNSRTMLDMILGCISKEVQ